MAAPVDSARNVTTTEAATVTSHAVNIGSPAANILLIVLVRFGAAPGTVTFTGYTLLGSAQTTDASDDETRVYYRWADGTEGATATLTTATAVKMAAVSWEVTGAEHPSVSAPTISTVAIGTTTLNTADPGSVAPAGAPQDTLYLAMMGLDGATKNPTAAPASYTNLVTGTTSGSTAATNCAVGGASRALTASSSDNPGVFTHPAANSAWTALTVAVRAATPPKQTGVAQISLAGTSTPRTRTNHAITVRGRVQSGLGTFRAALYEAGVNRSGDLESTALTTSLATYTLAIPDASAANITSYRDLEIRVWGYSQYGFANVFEVAEVSLSAPYGGSLPFQRRIPRRMLARLIQ